MNKSLTSLFIFSMALGFFSVGVVRARAAVIDLVPSSNDIAHQNQAMRVAVLLSPEKDTVNTVSLSVAFPDALEYVGVDDSDSIIGFWVDKPSVNKEQHVVSFSGIVPGGFSGLIDPFTPKNPKPGLVLTLLFKAHASGSFILTPGDIHVYRNDGQGSSVASTGRAATLIVDSVSVETTDEAAYDTISPIPFTPRVLARDPNLFEGKFAVIFSARDAGSGIDHYEVKEGEHEYLRAESPYVLKDQTLSGSVFVKAVDRAGNERVEQVILPPHAEKDTAKPYQTAVGIAIALIGFCAILLQAWLRRKHSRI